MPHKNLSLSINQANINPAAVSAKSQWLDRWQKLNRFTWPDATPLWLRISFDLAALIWIGWFAYRHAGFLLRNDLYLYGDHPGQFYRLWQLLTITWPEEGRFIGWSPYWFAGWPELQFYPPGFVLVGWLIWMGSFQKLSLFTIYEIVVFASFVLPAINFYLLMAWGFRDRLAGLTAAWLAMAAPFILGGAMGVIIGLLGERLAFGMIPLLILSGLWLMRAERRILPWLVTGLVLAWLMILHPYQAILPTIILGLYALFCGQGWQVRLYWLAATILLGFGLTAFWWLPLGLRSHLFVPVVEAPLVEIRSNLAVMWFEGASWLLAAAILGSLSRQGSRRWLSLAVFLGGVGILGLVFFSHHILVEKLNFFGVSSVRLITGVTFAFLASLALGLSELAWFGVRLLRRWGGEVWALPLVLIVPWLIYGQTAANYNFSKWMSKWQPAPGRTPFFLQEAEAKYNLLPVWEVMAATPGRVLFTSHYALFFDIPTSLKSITPFRSGREIIGGTFTHRMPVSTYLWIGQTDLPAIWGKVETEDDKTLAGVTWETMNEDFFFELARRFNATLIATTATDVRARAFLDASSRFKPVWSNGLFTFYETIGYEPAWVEAKHATAVVNQYERRAIDVQIIEAGPGATLSVKVTYYDLWQAEAEGQTLPIQADPYGLMRISLPPGSYTVHLRYKLGWPERLGETISLATALGAIGVFIIHQLSLMSFRGRRPRNPQGATSKSDMAG